MDSILHSTQKSRNSLGVNPFSGPYQVVCILGEDAVDPQEGLEDLVPLSLQVHILNFSGWRCLAR